MSVEQGVTEATVRIRTPRLGWMMLLVSGLAILATQALEWVVPRGGDNTSTVLLTVLGSGQVGEAVWMRTFGIDLTPQLANVRGIRRRSVPWSQVQAVLGYRHMGADRVALVLDSGERVVLRMPATYWGSGAATDVKYREDFHRLGQWWLAHRGPSWRPVRPEAPGALTLE
jgi:hypothetical protein